MADIFTEVDDDLRRERAQKLWQRYGGYVIGAAILVVIATGVFVFVRDQQQRAAEALGAQYTKAVELAREESDKAVQAFDQLAARQGAGYPMLARIQSALLKVKGKDRAGGIASLKAIMVDTSIDEAYRSVARLVAGYYGLEDEKPDAVIALVQPLTIAPNPWRFSAGEVTALAHMKAGDKAAALKTYQSLADDLAAPATLRARATEIANVLNH